MSDQLQSGTSPAFKNDSDSNIRQQNQRPTFLRRCSISDPHLDIVPNFAKEEKSLNPFNRMFSGLFSKGSNFSLNMLDASTESVERTTGGALSSANECDQEHHRQQLTKGNSSIELKTPSVPISGPAGLRKSATSASALYGTSPQTTGHFPAIPETEGQGLTMSARPMANHPEKALMGTIPSHTTPNSNPPKSGLKSLFGSGFLSRPVMHSQEENYRIIMALDR